MSQNVSQNEFRDQEMADTDDDDNICRVCRGEGSTDKPLYHPCICTGSIRYVHQDCLVQWLRHSKKEYCELCKYKYSFKPIYSPDMPSRLPVKDLVSGLLISVLKAVRSWLHYTLVAIAWLGVVPLTACRIYKCLFTGSVSSLLTLPMDLLSTSNIGHDIVYGSMVVACTMTSFIGLVWLREQIVNGGIPGWLNRNGAENELVQPGEQPPAVAVVNDDNNNVEQAAAADGEEQGNIHDNVDDVAGYSDEEESTDMEDTSSNGSDMSLDPENILENDDVEDEGFGVQDDGGAPELQPAGLPVDGDLPADNNQQDGLNWNGLEWDRAAEELTWERMLGLDGSLVFLEHVFWVVSLNTLFILVFAFCPYHLGHFVLAGVDLDVYLVTSRFEGLLTTLSGYIILATAFFLCHAAMFLLKMQRSGRILGIFYIVLKVALLIVGEMGVFPLVCGWWLDICSLRLFNATVQERATNYMNAPGTSTFFHWLMGMFYVFYFASFMILLREVLRPGALWFLRNLNDPDFNPIQELIHLPMYRHLRRFLLSVVIFGTAVLMVVYVPVQLIQRMLPGFLPYRVTLRRDAPVSDLSLELILLQVILPGLLEQGHTRQWLKVAVKMWAQAIGNLLGVRSYLLGDEDLAPEQLAQGDDHAQENEDQQEDNVDAHLLHQNLHPPALPQVDRDGEIHQPYTKPNHFALRVVLLIAAMCVTLSMASLTAMVVPIWIGRYIFSLWLGEASTNVHDLYPTAVGLYACWLVGQSVSLMVTWFPKGASAIWAKFKQVMRTMLKAVAVSLFAVGVFPLLCGLLFEQVIVVPLRVPLHQTPLTFLWQDWVLGILLVKLIVASTLLGPQWRIKAALERAYHQGLQNFDLKEVYSTIIHPVLCVLLLCLTIPYVLAHSVMYIFELSSATSTLLLRRIYPSIISAVALLTFLHFEAKQFRRLCDHIKNERYLVGKKLINYEPSKT